MYYWCGEFSARSTICSGTFSGTFAFCLGGVGLERLSKLIGAGSILFAANAFEQGDNLIGSFTFNKTADALKISAASADKFDVVDLVVVVQFKDDLF